MFELRGHAEAEDWSPPVALEAPGLPGRAQLGSIAGLQAVGCRTGVALMIRATSGVYMLARPVGGTWRPVIRLSKHPAGPAVARLQDTVALVVGRESVLAAWIDARHARSDRRHWNPLGGFPWSDSPEWANNDLFCVRVAIQDLFGHGDAAIHEQRLTALGGLITTVSGNPIEGGVLLLWSGREEVGRIEETSSQPPQLYILELPM